MGDIKKKKKKKANYLARCLIPVRVMVGLEPILVILGLRWEYIQECMTIHRKTSCIYNVGQLSIATMFLGSRTKPETLKL